MTSKAAAVKAVPDPPLTPRAANKAERAKRRDEIQQKWTARRAVRMLFAELDQANGAEEETQILFHYTEWIGLDVILGVYNARCSGVRMMKLVAHLARIIELKEMPYEEYLQTPEWQKLAKAAKERYRQRCALDDSHPAEHAHHRTYTRRGRELPEDLIPLCSACHKKFHDR